VTTILDRLTQAIRDADTHSCMYQEGIDPVELADAALAVVQPDLTQCDAQLEAVRALHHEWTDGAPGCCAHCQDGMGTPLPWPCPTIQALDVRRPQPPAAATPQPPLTWCAASMPGLGGEPIGPCVLRAGHDGPVHQAADGARWWTAAEPDPAPIDWATVPLTVKVFGAGPRPCESGRHTAHPGDTCEEADAVAAAWNTWWEKWARAVGYYEQPHTPPAGVPDALRGPKHPGSAGDPAPLRRLAEQALATDQPKEHP
jgi:hypothetical protein